MADCSRQSRDSTGNPRRRNFNLFAASFPSPQTPQTSTLLSLKPIHCSFSQQWPCTYDFQPQHVSPLTSMYQLSKLTDAVLSCWLSMCATIFILLCTYIALQCVEAITRVLVLPLLLKEGLGINCRVATLLWELAHLNVLPVISLELRSPPSPILSQIGFSA